MYRDFSQDLSTSSSRGAKALVLVAALQHFNIRYSLFDIGHSLYQSSWYRFCILTREFCPLPPEPWHRTPASKEDIFSYYQIHD